MPFERGSLMTNHEERTITMCQKTSWTWRTFRLVAQVCGSYSMADLVVLKHLEGCCAQRWTNCITVDLDHRQRAVHTHPPGKIAGCVVGWWYTCVKALVKVRVSIVGPYTAKTKQRDSGDGTKAAAAASEAGPAHFARFFWRKRSTPCLKSITKWSALGGDPKVWRMGVQVRCQDVSSLRRRWL